MEVVPCEPTGVVLQLPPSLQMNPDQFFDFCQVNRDLRIERTAKGEIIVMTPAGGETGGRNSEIARQLGNWAIVDGTGNTFDSSTGFSLPLGGDRSPDAAWVLRSRLAPLTAEQRRKFLPLCPDFVVELRSSSDRISTVREKMQMFMENGARLGFLVDPQSRQVTVYRPGAEPQVLNNPETVSGDPELPGFTLEMARIWNPGF